MAPAIHHHIRKGTPHQIREIAILTLFDVGNSTLIPLNMLYGIELGICALANRRPSIQERIKIVPVPRQYDLFRQCPILYGLIQTLLHSSAIKENCRVFA